MERENIQQLFNRGTALHQAGRISEAADCYKAVLAEDPKHADALNMLGTTHLQQGNTAEGVRLIGLSLEINRHQPAALNNRGIALRTLRRHGESLASFDRAIALVPNYADAHMNRGNTLREMGRYEEALASYSAALALNPRDAEAYSNRGLTLHAMRRYHEALREYDQAIALQPNLAAPYLNRGDTLANLGQMEAAEEMFRKALARRPGFPQALYSLTNIKKYQDIDDPDAAALRSALDTHPSGPDREYLHFALAKIYEDTGRYDDAFRHFEQANRIRNEAVKYDQVVAQKKTDRIIATFSKEFLRAPFPSSSPSEVPVFVVGMPRSGTTLLTSILSNHPSIASAGELGTIPAMASRLPTMLGSAFPYPEVVKHLTPSVATALIREYEAALEQHKTPGTRHVVDKLPHNYEYLGLISLLFPRARIIHCTRNPMDVCLSIYCQFFAEGHDYSFDLANIAGEYNDYIRLMDHWRSALPIKMLDVSYEDTVRNMERNIRAMLDFVGVEWDARCLSPHTNPHGVETASKWQVRQPVYTKSVGRWRRYERHLGPLKEILQGAA